MQGKRLTRVMAIMMVAVMTITMLCISGVSIVKAANGGTRVPGNEWLISKNNLASFRGEVSHYKLVDSEYTICPTNNAYYVASLNKGWPPTSLTEEEFRSVVADANNLPYDRTLTSYGMGLVTDSRYLSRDITVISANTDITVSARLDDLETYFAIWGYKADGTWDELSIDEGFAIDRTLNCGTFMKDEYIFYQLDTKESVTGANTTVHHLIVAEDKLDEFKKEDDTSILLPKTVDVGPAGTMYRLFNENSGEHLYTADAGEAQYLTDIDWNYEGHAWQAPTSSTTPVYRLFNPATGEHHYTKDEGERDYLDGIGWNYESIAFYSDDNKGVPMYRLFNPNATGIKQAGSHHYTKDEGERDYLIATGWNYEGISWYGM